MVNPVFDIKSSYWQVYRLLTSLELRALYVLFNLFDSFLWF